MMKKMGKTLVLLGPLLLLAGQPAARASNGPAWDGVGGLQGAICRLLGPLCPWNNNNNNNSGDNHHPHNGDPTPVPEPEMLGLFALGTLSAGAAAYRRRRK